MTDNGVVSGCARMGSSDIGSATNGLVSSASVGSGAVIFGVGQRKKPVAGVSGATDASDVGVVKGADEGSGGFGPVISGALVSDIGQLKKDVSDVGAVKGASVGSGGFGAVILDVGQLKKPVAGVSGATTDASDVGAVKGSGGFGPVISGAGSGSGLVSDVGQPKKSIVRVAGATDASDVGVVKGASVGSGGFGQVIFGAADGSADVGQPKKSGATDAGLVSSVSVGSGSRGPVIFGSGKILASDVGQPKKAVVAGLSARSGGPVKGADEGSGGFGPVICGASSGSDPISDIGQRKQPVAGVSGATDVSDLGAVKGSGGFGPVISGAGSGSVPVSDIGQRKQPVAGLSGATDVSDVAVVKRADEGVGPVILVAANGSGSVGQPRKAVAGLVSSVSFGSGSGAPVIFGSGRALASDSGQSKKSLSAGPSARVLGPVKGLSRCLLALVIVSCLLTTATATPDPQPTIGMLGRAVHRWFREGIRTVIGGEPVVSSVQEEAEEEGRTSAMRERVRLMIEERLKTKLDDGQQAAEARADPRPSGFRPGPTTELIGRFVANAISALQKPDGIVSMMRQKVGFVTANFRLSCYVCEMGVGLVKQFVYANRTLEEVADTLGNVCNLMTVTSERVCHGFLNEFLPEIMYVMGNIELLDEEVCGFVLGGNCIGRTYIDAFGWDVNIPMRTQFYQPETIFRRKPYATKLKVLHITDVHIDEDYVEGSVVDCGEPLCCREKKRSYGITQHRAGKWGSSGRCDTPSRTVDSLLDHLKEHHQFDYIIWTGDVPAHNIWQQSRDDNLYTMKRFNQKLKSYFPDTPIFPSVGNHESHPANSFPQPYIEGPFAIDYLYHALNASWSHLVPGNISETVLRGGFYSVLVKPGFRIISLNSNYCHNKNWWMLLDSKDPAGQLQWLVEELEMAEQNEEKVHIIGHIPPGSVDCAYVWSDNFNSIINRYQDTVSAQFYGHNHMDEFEIFYDKDDPSIPINVAYVGPSVSPYDGVNPAYKIFYVDGDYEGSPREVMDYETYYLDLEDANANDLPNWDILYSAKDAFGMRSLEPSEWHRLVGKMATNSDLFKEFYRYMYRRGNKKGCTGLCKELTLCRLKKAWAGASKEC